MRLREVEKKFNLRPSTWAGGLTSYDEKEIQSQSRKRMTLPDAIKEARRIRNKANLWRQ